MFILDWKNRVVKIKKKINEPEDTWLCRGIIMKNDNTLRNTWDFMKRIDVHVTWTPEERGKGVKILKINYWKLFKFDENILLIYTTKI